MLASLAVANSWQYNLGAANKEQQLTGNIIWVQQTKNNNSLAFDYQNGLERT
jgi:hypothetical protein